MTRWSPPLSRAASRGLGRPVARIEAVLIVFLRFDRQCGISGSIVEVIGALFPDFANDLIEPT